MGKKKQTQVKAPLEVPAIVPKFIRIDTAYGEDRTKMVYCLTFLDESKRRSESVGAYSDTLTRNKEGNVLVENMPPTTIDPWIGYTFDTEPDAVLAREAIRLFLAMNEGGLIENL